MLKVQRPHRLRPRTSLEKEAFFLHQLAAYPDIVVPHVLGYGRHGNIEYIVMTQMPESRVMVELTGVQRTDMLHGSGEPCDASTRFPRRLSMAPTLQARTQEEFVACAEEPGHVVQVIGATPNLWRLDVSGGPGVKVLAALPASIDLVALHSNPGPVHTFVRPDSLDFVGLIDFGDAYISHPALDWRWPTHADRVALLHGYCDDTGNRRVYGRLACSPGAQRCRRWRHDGRRGPRHWSGCATCSTLA